jgi:peptidoglycan/LPS O-acetylase OafA/YrhL
LCFGLVCQSESSFGLLFVAHFFFIFHFLNTGFTFFGHTLTLLLLSVRLYPMIWMTAFLALVVFVGSYLWMKPEANTEGERKGNFAYLDGVRGLAALLVVGCHFIQQFYPAMHVAQRAPSMTPWDTMIAFSPLHLAISGELCVALFFVLSGFVLSYSYLKTPITEKLISGMFRRYFRLAVPIFGTSLLYLLGLQSGLYPWALAQLNTPSTLHIQQYLAHFLQITYSLPDMIRDALLITPFQWQHDKYNFALWTMSVEFYGSVCIFLSLWLMGRSKWRSWGFAAMMLLVCGLCKKMELMGFFMGMILCDGVVSGWLPRLMSRPAIGLAAGLVGLAVGSINLRLDEVQILSGHFAWAAPLLKVFKSTHMLAFAFLSVGASGLMAWFLTSPTWKALLSWRPIQWLGQVSFGLYLSHLLVQFTVMPTVFMALYQGLGWNYHGSALLALGISVPLQFLLAHGVYHSVDRAAVRVGHLAYQSVKPWILSSSQKPVLVSSPVTVSDSATPAASRLESSLSG